MKQPVVALSAPQKPDHPFSVQDSKGTVSEAYCPDLQCTPQDGMGKNVGAAQWLELCVERKRSFCCVSLERSDLSYIGRGEEREEAAVGGETTKGDEENRQRPKRRAVRIQCPLQKMFQLPRDLSYTRRAWQKFRYRLGSFPQPAARRGAARRVMTRRGEARRAAEEERAWISLLFSCSYMWGKNLPYKKVQLPLN